jgi:MFS family permease
MRIFEKDELKNLWPFYIERFIAFLFYFAPAFWVLQFQQYLSLFQIGVLFSVLSISTFIFEIPTGAFADLYGRKTSVLLGYFLTAIAVIFLYFTRDFTIFVLIFFIWGLAGTFVSGAKESWVVDNLKYKRKKHLIKSFFIKEQSITSIALFFSGFLGAYLVNKSGLSIIWPFAALSYLTTGIILIFIKEYKLTKEKTSKISDLLRQSKVSIKYALGHHVLFFIITATFFIMFRDAFGGDLVWQPFLKNLGLPVYAFGFIFSISTLFGVFASLFSKPFSRLFKKEKNYLAFLLLITIVLDFLVIFVNSYIFGVILLFLMFITIYLFTPINSNFFHSHIPGKLRATVTSFNGMVIALAYALSSPLSGYLADIISPRYTIALGSIILIPALILYLKIKDKKERKLKKNSLKLLPQQNAVLKG